VEKCHWFGISPQGISSSREAALKAGHQGANAFATVHLMVLSICLLAVAGAIRGPSTFGTAFQGLVELWLGLAAIVTFLFVSPHDGRLDE
jgi:hypothetical protein